MPKYALAVPDPVKGWILHTGGNSKPREDRDLHHLIGKRSDVLIGLPSSLVSTFSVSLPTTDSSLFRDMVYAQIEKRGLQEKSGLATVFDYEILNQSAGHTDLVVHVLQPELPEDVILPNAAGYSCAALFHERPENGCLLWKEHKRFAFAVFQDDQLVHSQVLSGAPELGAGIAQEINLSLLALQSDSALEDFDPQPLRVVGLNPTATEIDSFDSVLRIPVEYEKELNFRRRIRPLEKLLPQDVVNSRRRKRALKRNLLLVTLGLFAYSVIGFLIWKKAENTEAEIKSLERQISLLQPEVQQVMLAQQKWKELQPAFDLRYFPIVQLSKITSALPGSGVVIREFKTNDREIEVEAQARDVQLANRLEEDLRAMSDFHHYEWHKPNPQIGRNNIASFKLVGTPKNEGPEQ